MTVILIDNHPRKERIEIDDACFSMIMVCCNKRERERERERERATSDLS